MAIESKKKEEVTEIIFENKRSELDSEGTEYDLEEIRKQSQEEAKKLNLNCVRLCFEAFNKNNLEIPLCQSILSEPIHNQKSTLAGDLRITRLSSASGSCRGGDEVILLCEKINKDDIKVRFYEKDEHDHKVWIKYGDFNPKADVHHQVAITFKTPPYKHQDAERFVWIDLYRPSDNKNSEAREFRYIPDEIHMSRFTKKRKVSNTKDNFMEIQSPSHASSSWQVGNSTLGMINHGQGVDLNLLEVQDQEYRLPFPENSSADAFSASVNSIKKAESNESSEWRKCFGWKDYSGYYDGVESILIDGFDPTCKADAIQFCNENTTQPNSKPTENELLNDRTAVGQMAESFTPVSRNENSVASPVDMDSSDIEWDNFEDILAKKWYKKHGEEVELSTTDQRNSSIQIVTGQIHQNSAGMGKGVLDYIQPSQKGQMTEDFQCYHHTSSESFMRQKFKALATMFLSSIGSYTLSEAQSKKNVGHVEYAENARTATNSDKQPQSGREMRFSLHDKHAGRKMKNFHKGSTKNANFEHFKESINQILRNRQQKTYIQYISSLITMQDENGNTFLHLAVLEQSENLNFIAKMLDIAPEIVRKKNRFHETVLHLAINRNMWKVLLLLLVRGGNPSVVNQDGDNCFHIAAKFNYSRCMKILLFLSLKYGKYIPSINALNYDGFAPLHLSVTNNAEECMKLLLQAHADVNIIDGKTGRSPLHFAVEQHPSLISSLLSQLNIDLEVMDFRGYTPLHSACDIKGVLYEDISSRMDDDNAVISFLRNLAEELKTQKSTLEELQDTYHSCNSNTSTDSDSDQEVRDLSKSEMAHCDNGTVGSHQSQSIKDEERLCHLLDANCNWKKLGKFIGMNESSLKNLGKFSKGSGPSKVILKKFKTLYPKYDEVELIQILKD